MNEEFKKIIDPNETILYEGKPEKRCYVFESIFNPLLPFALLWAFLDISLLANTFLMDTQDNMTLMIIPFMLIHMMPVWIYLGGILFTVRRYRNTLYVITDKAIYVSGGIFTKSINTKSFLELSHIDLHRGIFDQKFKVGDIIATTNQLNQNGKSTSIVISSISDYINVYNLVKKLQTDIYTDAMYPNAKRPSENPGYNTRYKGM